MTYLKRPLHFFTLRLTLTLLIGLAGFAQAEEQSIPQHPFSNGDFEQAITIPSAWLPVTPKIEGAKVTYGVSSLSHTGRQSALIEVAPDSTVNWYTLEQRVEPVSFGQTYRFSCWIKTDKVDKGAGAYVAVNIMAPGRDERLGYTESERVIGTADWTQVVSFVYVPRDVKVVKLCLILNGTGRAWFDGAQFKLLRTAGALPENKVSLKLTGRTLQDQFLGFGIEDDPFFFVEANVKRGVNEADFAMRVKRLKALQPATIKSLLYWDAFNPSHDMKTFVYDTPLMKSLYRQFDVLQRMGIPILISDTHWGWSATEFPYTEQNAERGVETYLKILEYLIVQRGYTCIKYVTITAEPDLFFPSSGGTFDSYIKTCKLFHEKLMKSPLAGKLTLVGCDIGNSNVWFRETVRQADECFGMYSFHNYLQAAQFPIIREIAQELLTDLKGTNKSLYLWEYGFQFEGDDVNHNRAMREFGYGLWNANNCIEMMNLGVRGALVWGLHTMYYDEGNFMQYGLWEFKDQNWAIRPIYYSHGLFMRFARPGMKPVKLEASATSSEFNAAAMKDNKGRVTLFLLNLSPKPVAAAVAKLPKGTYKAYEYSRAKLQAAKTQANYEEMEALAAGSQKIGSDGQKAISLQPETLVVLRQE